MTDSQRLLSSEFATLPDLVRRHTATRPDAIAVSDAALRLCWVEMDSMSDGIAARLQAEGLTIGARVAIAGQNSAQEVAVPIGALRAGRAPGWSRPARRANKWQRWCATPARPKASSTAAACAGNYEVS